MGNAASQPGANQQQSQPNGCNQAQNPSEPGSPPCGVDQDPSLPAQPPAPPQHMANIPPPMMLSGATPIRAPGPVADQHKHLWTQPPGGAAQPQTRRQKQPPCGRNQAPCPPAPCPPMAFPQAFQPAQQQQQHDYNGANQYATPSHGVTGGTSYLLGPAAPSYSEGPSDPIPPERPYHDSPQLPSNGKIVCQQIYPKILQNYQNGSNGSASASSTGVPGAVTLSTPSYVSNVTASELAVQRPIIGGAL